MTSPMTNDSSRGRAPRFGWAPLALCLATLALSSCTGFRASTTRVETAKHVADSAVEITSRNGRIQLIASPSASEVTVHATLVAGGNTQIEADERLAKLLSFSGRGE